MVTLYILIVVAVVVVLVVMVALRLHSWQLRSLSSSGINMNQLKVLGGKEHVVRMGN
jgi:hypothetical protein